ncbi:methyl-accepting chemotaxis protein [Anaerocolumna sp. AGMB13025]|uniref:methyl-accepting chemotaxis protein n=1 Tax=Anaerocolumna sp. AGMB13025 TaxID=3039116 RepID=UPI00241C4E1E|nr:methyl-accepting chemotaxis protein [Anaerocolumna sp. AGMB13025]WFR56220.1 methyl-accepting chemotaxis protein [Anaerocolumna sp. AGMB13025]
MNVLNKLRIRTKLIILLVFMVGCTFLIGVVGYTYTNNSHVALTNLYRQNLITVELLSDARTQARANYANAQKLMLITDSASKDETNADIDKRNNNIKKDFEEFQKTDQDDYEIKQMELINKKMADWNLIFQNIRDLAGSGKTEEAIGIYEQKGEAVFEDLQTSIRDMVDYAITEADTIYQENNASNREALIFLSVLIVSITVISIILGVMIAISITNPVAKAVTLIKKTSDLDLVNDASFETMLKYRGEIGAIVRSVFEMRNALRNVAETIIAVSTELASNSAELSESTDSSTKTINQVANAINEIAEGNGTQAEMVTKTSAAMKDISASIDEVNKAIETNADNAGHSLAIVSEGQQAVDLTILRMQDNIAVTKEVGESIRELSELMLKVNNITGLINEIASQTNLLALNAAIEAARAGEAGKGFAVVAEEIRKLAEGSSTAVKEITDIISDTVAKNKVAEENMNKVKEIVTEQESAVKVTKEVFSKIQESVDDIANKTKALATVINKIDTSSREIAYQTQDMAAVAQEAAASSEEISASSEEQLASMELISKASAALSEMAVELKSEISKFHI